MARNNRVGNTHEKMLDQVSIMIEHRLCGLPRVPCEKSIFKVHNQLRMVNEKAYEPVSVAIGPYHHSNDHRLQQMEEEKLHYLQQMLRRRGETSVDKYMQALRKIEGEVRQQYAGAITLTQQEFLAMMLLDGFFIIEYFRKYKMKALGDENDPLLNVDWIRYSIQRDLLLLENQLPFKVLTTLYDLTKDDQHFNEQHTLVGLSWNFFGVADGLSREKNPCKHLLDLVYQGMVSNVSPIAPLKYGKKSKIEFINSATALKAAGIKFKSLRSPNVFNTFNIKFNKGTLEIPTIIIQDHTEAFYRNLVAYEQQQHCQGEKINYVSDYITFMDCLVNTPEDVEVLCRKKIINNFLSDNEVVSTMFNKIGDYVTVDLSNFYYESIFYELNKHCGKRRHHWMEVLRRDYFRSPWTLISVIAAIMLLLFTLVQTIYTVLSFYLKD